MQAPARAGWSRPRRPSARGLVARLPLATLCGRRWRRAASHATAGSQSAHRSAEVSPLQRSELVLWQLKPRSCEISADGGDRLATSLAPSRVMYSSRQRAGRVAAEKWLDRPGLAGSLRT